MQQQDSKIVLIVARGAEAQGTLDRIAECQQSWERERDAEQQRHFERTLTINGRLASEVCELMLEHERRLALLAADDDDDDDKITPF